jgi:plastocyanin
MTTAAANVNHAFASSCSISVTSPEPQTVHSGGLEEIKAGEHFVITTLIINRCSEDQPFISIIEVRNSDGVTEYLRWHGGVLKGSTGMTQVGTSWVPPAGGDCELRTFAISGLANPQILSTVMTTNITIAAEDPGKAIMTIPYDPDPSLQQITFEPSLIKVILGVNNTIKWTNGDTVSHRLAGDYPDPVKFERAIFVYRSYSFEHTFTEAGEFRYIDRGQE